MKVAENKVITINYTLRDDNKKILDSAQNNDFLYLHGAQNIIPGLESALEGKAVNDELSVSIAPADGYGERNDDMTQVVPKEMFGTEEGIEVGQQFHAASPDGQEIMVTIVAVDDENITVDGNHPLAGVTLHFEVQIMDIRDASAEELEHGHAHGPDGHHHH